MWGRHNDVEPWGDVAVRVKTQSAQSGEWTVNEWLCVCASIVLSHCSCRNKSDPTRTTHPTGKLGRRVDHAWTPRTVASVGPTTPSARPPGRQAAARLPQPTQQLGGVKSCPPHAFHASAPSALAPASRRITTRLGCVMDWGESLCLHLPINHPTSVCLHHSIIPTDTDSI